ncbi:hypothetical protein [Pseudomonas sp. MWU12-2345]|uniref:hypothetical protein n=1 Tax=Pseudomonas sp. MWU12-2345 TaxID=2928689 RepID=UPI00200C52E9|nr:hypothetical protein [Pseudomonas sp. MWU12-2345]
MYQIDNSTAVAAIPASTAAGTNGYFTDGNPATGVPATIMPAEFMNMLMMENLNVLTAAGIAPVKNQFNQLALSIAKIVQNGAAGAASETSAGILKLATSALAAAGSDNTTAITPQKLAAQIQAGGLAFATDTGTVNTYVCTFVPALTARIEGQVLRFKVKTTSTGACTINDGLGVVPMVGGAHAALQNGELVANGDAWIQWNTSVGGGSYILLFCTGAAEQVASATQSQHAVNAGQLQTGALAFATDTGTANTYVCAFSPTITARAEGQVLRFKVKTTNTGASTINDGVGVVALVGGAHAALQGGELVANGDAWVQWNTSVGGGSYILLFCTGAAEQVANATQSQQAVAMGQLFGGLKGISRISTSGSFTVPAGVTTIYVSGCGGGGGGGGGGGSSSGAPTSGAGGGGGGGGQQIFRVPYTVTPGQVIAITTGTAGTAGAGGYGAASGGAGAAGGATTIGSLVTLNGGSAGLGGASGGAGGSGGAGYPGGSDGGDCTNNQCTGIGGMGGSSSFGGGGGGGRAGSGGGAVAKAAAGYGGGGGGGGGSYGATAAGGNGAAGTGGLVIIEW